MPVGRRRATAWSASPCSAKPIAPWVSFPRQVRGRARMGISPNFLDLTKVEDNGTVKALYVDQIFEAADEFLTTAQALTAFTETHVPKWGERVLILPDTAHVGRVANSGGGRRIGCV